MQFSERRTLRKVSGGNNRKATPVPIPNTEVKLPSADDTWVVTPRESRSPPDYMKKICDSTGLFLYIRKKESDMSDIKPSIQQLKWQKMEFTGFVHFGINTFTGREWGDGTEDPGAFDPRALDAGQWVEVFKKAGMKLLILTAKHHDGFCLWPSRFTEHSVKNSPWRNGTGDVVREAARACKAGGIKFGIYMSPWDRHEKTYGDSKAYNEYYINQLTELLTSYGEITEVWLDGACGEGAGGKKQEYDWEGYYRVIRQHQPDALIAICGPDIRWVGNEDGYAGETQWSVQERDGKVWWPSECDVSIRPGWFYHKKEDGSVKTTKELLDIYYRSVGRNTVLLLNVPPDKRGLINEIDAKRLEELGEIIGSTFKDNQASGASIGTEEKMFEPGHPAYEILGGDYDRSWKIEGYEDGYSMIFDLKKRVEFDLVQIQEDISLGQNIEKYSIAVWDGQRWKNIVEGTTVGYKRINKTEKISTDKVCLTIEKAMGTPVISSFGLYLEKDI